MKILLNGEAQELAHSELHEIIKQHEFKPPFAVAINNTFVPKHLYVTTYLQDGDTLDVVSPIQGG
ncbi:sulfur carrier protein ThiS [Gilvimarinus polysaccharolyticus]|uniref:sulfur carrier protein ThiS n=1 Tax=Gilvimarinus polysaccharolyticus TaxID=863921 RepID=UPI000673255F|nr:sulfur carrier protein ThiS [Gilvimarinus polysaccharolyticus]